jgi:O-antigen biosynthesis protein
LITAIAHWKQLPIRLWRLLRREGVAGLARRLRPLRARPSYKDWIAAHRLTDNDRREIAAHIAAWTDPPLISVLLPVYNSRPAWLRACLDSVFAQSYSRWELCICDDASTDPSVRSILAEYAARDPRVKVFYRSENGHIAAATNSALELAGGAFAAFLDHDDTLAEQALYMVAAVIMENPETALLYSDSDTMGGSGKRFNPAFKPGWSPDLLRAHNYINHLAVLRTELVRAVGGLRTGLEGAQDHDLLLRASEQVSIGAIRHIPQVLYHWRAHSGSMGRNVQTLNRTGAASRKVIADCLDRQGVAAEVLTTTAHPFLHRVRYQLPDSLPLASIIITTCDRLDLLRPCVEGVLHATHYSPLELIIIDNGSRNPATLAYLQELSRQSNIRCVHQASAFNFAELNNSGASLAQGEVLCFLNNDVVITQPGWLGELISQALRPEIGAAGPMLRYMDGRIQHAGIALGTGVVGRLILHQAPGKPSPAAFQLQEVRNVAALTGACLVMRRALFQQVGGFDAALAVAYNDIDLCLKLRAAGYLLVCTPFAELVHLGSASRGQEDTHEKRARLQDETKYLFAKWGAFAASDPFINPNMAWMHGWLDSASSSASVRLS